MSNKKYELTEETKTLDNGIVLYRIKRLSDGMLGGWIESESNLSQEGLCWVDMNAKVYGDAQVFGNAYVFGKAQVYDDARVYGNARVYEDAQVYGSALVYGEALVYGKAKAHGDALVSGNARVYEDSSVYGNAKVYGDARVYDDAHVSGDARVYEDAWVFGQATVSGNSIVTTSVLTVDSTRHTITVTDNNCSVGCENHSHEHWLEHVTEIGKENNYSTEEIELHRDLIFSLIRMKKHQLGENQ